MQVNPLYKAPEGVKQTEFENPLYKIPMNIELPEAKKVNPKDYKYKTNFVSKIFTDVKEFFYTHFTKQGRLELKEIKLINQVNDQSKIHKTEKKLRDLVKRLDVFEQELLTKNAEYFEGTEGKARFAQYQKIVKESEKVNHKLETQIAAKDNLIIKLKTLQNKKYGLQIVNQRLAEFKQLFAEAEIRTKSADRNERVRGFKDLENLLVSLNEFAHEYDAVFVQYPKLREEVEQFENQAIRGKTFIELGKEKQYLAQHEALLKRQMALKEEFVASREKKAADKFNEFADITAQIDNVNKMKIIALGQEKQYLAQNEALLERQMAYKEEFIANSEKKEAGKLFTDNTAQIDKVNKERTDISNEIRKLVIAFKDLGSEDEKKINKARQTELNSWYTQKGYQIEELQRQQQKMNNASIISEANKIYDKDIQQTQRDIESIKQQIKKIESTLAPDTEKLQRQQQEISDEIDTINANITSEANKIYDKDIQQTQTGIESIKQKVKQIESTLTPAAYAEMERIQNEQIEQLNFPSIDLDDVNAYDIGFENTDEQQKIDGITLPKFNFDDVSTEDLDI